QAHLLGVGVEREDREQGDREERDLVAEQGDGLPGPVVAEGAVGAQQAGDAAAHQDGGASSRIGNPSWTRVATRGAAGWAWGRPRRARWGSRISAKRRLISSSSAGVTAIIRSSAIAASIQSAVSSWRRSTHWRASSNQRSTTTRVRRSPASLT